MEMSMKMFSVGEIRKEWIGQPDSYLIDYHYLCGFTLFIFLNRPSLYEIKEISAKSTFLISFSEYKNAGFFTLKFGDLPYGDCPFLPNLYEENLVFPNLPDEKGFPLNILLIDSSCGRLLNIRQVGLGHEFSCKVKDWSEKVMKKKLSRRDYDRSINECFSKYSPADMIKRSLASYYLP